MADTNPILSFGPPPEIELPGGSATGGPVQLQKSASGSFGDMFSSFLTDVNSMQVKADQSIQKMVTGEIKDVHQVMLAVDEAKVAFNLLLEIRNKTMDAYNQVMQMKS